MSTQPIISREEARALGLQRYFTGKPCKQGHISERYLSQSTCVACAFEQRQQHLKRYHNDPNWRARRRESVRRWHRKQTSYNSKVCDIYLVLSPQTATIKIGRASDWQHRMVSLRGSNGGPLEVIGLLRGVSPIEELLLHDRFSHLRLHGEWFKAEDEIFAYAEEYTELPTEAAFT